MRQIESSQIQKGRNIHISSFRLKPSWLCYYIKRISKQPIETERKNGHGVGRNGLGALLFIDFFFFHFILFYFILFREGDCQYRDWEIEEVLEKIRKIESFLPFFFLLPSRVLSLLPFLPVSSVCLVLIISRRVSPPRRDVTEPKEIERYKKKIKI